MQANKQILYDNDLRIQKQNETKLSFNLNNHNS